jgi:hypothetical protein
MNARHLCFLLLLPTMTWADLKTDLLGTWEMRYEQGGWSSGIPLQGSGLIVAQDSVFWYSDTTRFSAQPVDSFIAENTTPGRSLTVIGDTLVQEYPMVCCDIPYMWIYVRLHAASLSVAGPAHSPSHRSASSAFDLCGRLVKSRHSLAPGLALNRSVDGVARVVFVRP